MTHHKTHVPNNLTDEALTGIFDRERQKHRIPASPVRIGEVIPEVIADILRRRNRRASAKTRISGSIAQSRRRQYGGIG